MVGAVNMAVNIPNNNYGHGSIYQIMGIAAAAGRGYFCFPENG